MIATPARPMAAARAAMSSGAEAPSRNEKLVWQWSSAYAGVVRSGSGDVTVPAVMSGSPMEPEGPGILEHSFYLDHRVVHRHAWNVHRLTKILRDVRALAEPGPYPAAMAWMLVLPIRRWIISPQVLADRLGLTPSDEVLELGCGPGYFSAEIARRVPAGHVHLADIQPEMLEKARARLTRAGCTNATFTVTDAAGLPYADASMDVAFLVTVLGEISDPAAALRELHRVLRPGGTLSITEAAGDPGLRDPAALDALLGPAGFERTATAGGRRAATSTYRRSQADHGEA